MRLLRALLGGTDWFAGAWDAFRAPPCIARWQARLRGAVAGRKCANGRRGRGKRCHGDRFGLRSDRCICENTRTRARAAFNVGVITVTHTLVPGPGHGWSPLHSGGFCSLPVYA